MWLSYMIPKIRVADDFRVLIQKTVLKDITSLVTETTKLFGGISEYFQKRAYAILQIAKAPQIDDYRKTVQVIIIVIIQI